MAMFPSLRATDAVLTPASFRSGERVREDLVASGVPGVPGTSVFTELFCPLVPSRISMQYDVRAEEAGPVLGCATLMDLDPHAQHVRLGLFVDPRAEATQDQAGLLALNAAFAMWNVRKVYVRETHGAWSWTPPAAVVEATLGDYLHDGSQLFDMDVVATYRSDWDRAGAAKLQGFLAD